MVVLNLAPPLPPVSHSDTCSINIAIAIIMLLVNCTLNHLTTPMKQLFDTLVQGRSQDLLKEVPTAVLN